MIFFYYICGQSHCQRMLSLNGRCHRTILMTLVNQEGTVRQSVLIPIRKGMNVPIKLMIISYFLSCHQEFFSIFITNECTRIDMALQSYRLLLFCFFSSSEYYWYAIRTISAWSYDLRNEIPPKRVAYIRSSYCTLNITTHHKVRMWSL